MFIVLKIHQEQNSEAHL